jgi:hypothetical protein
MLSRSKLRGAFDDWLLDGKPTAFQRSNIPRSDATADTAVLTTQVMASFAIPVYAGDVITSLTFLSGATGAGTPTNWWFALYNDAATPALLSQSADQLTTAWAADTAKTLALAAPQVNNGDHTVWYASVMMKATTPNSLVGVNLGRAGISTGALAAQKVLARTSGAALTTTAPPTIASATSIVGLAYVLAT